MADKVQAKPWENPLTPHALLQRMYAGMQALRSATPAAAADAGFSPRGQEACRASSLLSLQPQDLISDLPASTLAQQRPRSRLAGVIQTLAPNVRLLPSPEDALDRLRLALGAAAALRVQAQRGMVLAYVEGNALSPAAWKQLLHVAGPSDLPIVLMLLPASSTKLQGVLSDRAQSWGVPGIPVDAADPIALYRVMQETALRARSGDGPALIECIAWHPASHTLRPADGLDTLRRQLRARGLLPRRQTNGAAKGTRHA